MTPAHHTFGITWLSTRTLIEHQTVVWVLHSVERYRILHRAPFSSVLYPSLPPKDTIKVFQKPFIF